MRLWLTLVLVLAFTGASSALERCYSSLDNPGVTITDDPEDGYTLVRKSGKETTVMDTRSGGTGIPVRVATESNGNTHPYRYEGDMLIMDMEVYYLGCPGGRTWVDELCSRVLISQVDAYAEKAQFYYWERGSPITSCSAPAPLKDGEVVSMNCFSGRVLRMDASNYPQTLDVGSVEMRVDDGPLACHPQ
jgi:hypothetical protein